MSWVGSPCFVAHLDQVLHQVAHREVGRGALAAVAELLAVLQRLHVGHVQGLDLVADAAQRVHDEVVVGQRQPRDQHRGVLALIGPELLLHVLHVLLALESKLLGLALGEGGELGVELRLFLG